MMRYRALTCSAAKKRLARAVGDGERVDRRAREQVPAHATDGDLPVHHALELVECEASHAFPSPVRRGETPDRHHADDDE